MTALHIAAIAGHPDIVQLMLEAHAAPDEPDRYGVTALCLTAGNEHRDAVRLLLEAGSSVTMSDNL